MLKRTSALDFFLALTLGGLFLVSFRNQEFFHYLAEMFRISVAIAIFMLIWNVRGSLDNPYLMAIGVAYVFVTGLDVLHLIAEGGMDIFGGAEANLSAQFRIAARYLEVAALLAASFFIGRKVRLRLVFLACGAVSAFIIASIFPFSVFPTAIGKDLAPSLFLKIAELIVLIAFAAAVLVLVRKRSYFDRAVARLLILAVSCAFLSELCLSFFISAEPALYLLGHVFKIISFYFIYKAIVETGLAKPLSVLFRNLKASEDALRRERDFIAGVLSSKDVIVAVLDRLGQIIRFNRAAERTTGYSFEEVRGQPPWRTIFPDRAEELTAVLKEIVVTGAPMRREISFLTKRGDRAWLLLSTDPLKDEDGKVEHLVISGLDITERKRAEEALQLAHDGLEARVKQRTRDLAEANERLRMEIEERLRIEDALLASEEKYRMVADNTYDWEWWRDSKGLFIYSSPSCGRITHHRADEFLADPGLLLRIIHPDDCALFRDHDGEVEQSEKTGEIEFRIIRPDGSVRWLAHACQPVLDKEGRLRGRRGSNRDITPRKEMEEALRESERQLRRLSSQILSAQETERQRIARELHDELGGALAVLKLRTSFLEKNLPQGQEDLKNAGRQSLDDIDRIIDNLARLSRDLSPSILEDLGLNPALRWLIAHFIKNYKVDVDAEILDLGHLFRGDSQIMIYRIIQEALANIGKHAQADKACVRVEEEGETMTFVIEDNGRGFDPGAVDVKNPSEKGLGLATMRERARILGGSLEISGRKGRGTRLVLRIPVERDKSR